MENGVSLKTSDIGESLQVTVNYGNHSVFEDEIGLYAEFFPNAFKAVIHRIFVPDEDQGKGYGRKMIAAFEDLMREKGCRSIRIGLASNLNQRDLKIIKKVGFVCVDEDNAIYEKKL